MTNDRAADARRRVLMVLYHFPPIGGISMSRNVRNVQYLPEHGWAPVVLTPGPADSGVDDPGSLALVPPGQPIIRTGYLEVGDLGPFVGAARRVARAVTAGSDRRAEPSAGALATALPSAPPTDPPGADPVPQPGDRVRDLDDGLGPRLAAIRRLLFFPDNQAGWFPFALVAALRSHRSQPFDAVFSTFPPMTSHLVAAAFRRITGVPWVAEFRDPWIGNVLESRPPWVIRQLRRKAERWAVRSADRVVAVTPRLATMLERRYPGLEVDLVTNGYDRSETIATAPREVGDRTFRIVYTGTLDRPAELAVFLAGLELALDRDEDLADRIRIDIYGNVAPACRTLIATFTRHDGRRDTIALRGFVPRTDALQAVAGADAALVLLGDGPGMDLFMPGKLFDYLGADRQVLAMLTDGDARDLLARLGWGVTCRPDPASVAEAIRDVVGGARPDRPADPTGSYDRRMLAGRLAGALDRATSARPQR